MSQIRTDHAEITIDEGVMIDGLLDGVVPVSVVVDCGDNSDRLRTT